MSAWRFYLALLPGGLRDMLRAPALAQFFQGTAPEGASGVSLTVQLSPVEWRFLLTAGAPGTRGRWRKVVTGPDLIGAILALHEGDWVWEEHP